MNASYQRGRVRTHDQLQREEALSAGRRTTTVGADMKEAHAFTQMEGKGVSMKISEGTTGTRIFQLSAEQCRLQGGRTIHTEVQEKTLMQDGLWNLVHVRHLLMVCAVRDFSQQPDHYPRAEKTH